MTDRGRVLIIEQDPSYAALLSLYLQHYGFGTYTAHALSEGEQQLSGYRPDLILCSDKYRSRAKSKTKVPIETLQKLRSVAPVMVLAETLDMQYAQQAIARGITDYVVKEQSAPGDTFSAYSIRTPRLALDVAKNIRATGGWLPKLPQGVYLLSRREADDEALAAISRLEIKGHVPRVVNSIASILGDAGHIQPAAILYDAASFPVQPMTSHFLHAVYPVADQILFGKPNSTREARITTHHISHPYSHFRRIRADLENILAYRTDNINQLWLHSPTVYGIFGLHASGKSRRTTQFISGDPLTESVVTVTTRPPRPGERQGFHHIFMSDEEFARAKSSHAFMLDYEFYDPVLRRNVSYAIPLDQVFDSLIRKANVVFNAKHPAAADKAFELFDSANHINPAQLIYIWRDMDRLVSASLERDNSVPGNIAQLQKEFAQRTKLFDFIYPNSDTLAHPLTRAAMDENPEAAEVLGASDFQAGAQIADLSIANRWKAPRHINDLESRIRIAKLLLA